MKNKLKRKKRKMMKITVLILTLYACGIKANSIYRNGKYNKLIQSTSYYIVWPRIYTNNKNKKQFILKQPTFLIDF